MYFKENLFKSDKLTLVKRKDGFFESSYDSNDLKNNDLDLYSSKKI